MLVTQRVYLKYNFESAWNTFRKLHNITTSHDCTIFRCLFELIIWIKDFTCVKLSKLFNLHVLQILFPVY